MTIPEPVSAPEPPTPPAPRPSWWKQNRFALVAIAVFAPATIAAIGGHHWYESYGYGNLPYKPIIVDEKQDAEFVGSTFGPVRSARIEDVSGLDVPPDSQVIGVAMPVDPGPDGVYCTVTLVDQATGREWTSSRTELGVLSNNEEPESCSTYDKDDYELIVPFVLPEDVEGPFWADVRSPGELSGGSFLRFPIDP